MRSGWHSCNQDIGWAEAAVIELVVAWLTQCMILALRFIVTTHPSSHPSGKVIHVKLPEMTA